MIDQLLSLYRQIHQSWLQNIAIIPEDLAGWGLPNMARSDIQNHLESQIKILEILQKEGGSINGFLKRQIPNIIATLTPVVSWAQQLPSNPTGMTQNIVNHLDSARNSLAQYGFGFSDHPGPFIDTQLSRLKSLEEQVRTAQTSIDQALTAKGQLEQLQQNALRIRQQLDADMTLLGNHRTDSQHFVSDMARTREEIEHWKSEVQVALGSFNESMGSLENMRQDLAERKKILNETAALAEKKAADIEKTLAAANRVGLASSFTEQRNKLFWPIVIWALAFFGAISVLTAIGIFVIQPTLVRYEGSERLTNLLLELPLAGPAIWFAWFSAVRYSYTERIRQDYAFKAAVALALDGFKAEADKTKPELALELVTNATRIFAQHPLRIYANKINDVSPMTHLADSDVPKNIASSLGEVFERIMKGAKDTAKDAPASATVKEG